MKKNPTPPKSDKAAVARPTRATRSSRKPAAAERAPSATPVAPVEATFPPLRRARMTMPEPDFAKIRALKERLRGLDRSTRKNELLRAGLAALSAMADEELLLLVEQLDPTKPPRKSKAGKRVSATRRVAAAGGSARARKSAAKIDD